MVRGEAVLPGDAAKLASSNPGNTIVTRGRELRRVKLACAFRKRGVAFTLSHFCQVAMLANHWLMYVEGG